MRIRPENPDFSIYYHVEEQYIKCILLNSSHSLQTYTKFKYCANKREKNLKVYLHINYILCYRALSHFGHILYSCLMFHCDANKSGKVVLHQKVSTVLSAIYLLITRHKLHIIQMQVGTNVWDVTCNPRTMHLDNESLILQQVLPLVPFICCCTFCSYALPFNRKSSMPVCMCVSIMYVSTQIKILSKTHRAIAREVYRLTYPNGRIRLAATNSGCISS